MPFAITLTSIMLLSSCPAIASPERLHPAPTWQTDLTPQDRQAIKQLVEIALRHSAEVKAARTALGWSAFTEVAEVELSSYESSDRLLSIDGSERGTSNGLSTVLRLYPIQMLSSLQQLPVLRRQLQEAQQQQRLEVVERYLNYVQAKQAVEIAAYQMQQLSATDRQLDNPAYAELATALLSANTQLHLALEQLAASVGLSTVEVLELVQAATESD